MPFWILVAFLIVVFLTGGASRSDTWSSVLLGPLSILTCSIAALSLKREHLWRQKWLLAGFALIFGLVAAHLVPLSPAMSNLSQDYPDVASITGSTWRPYTTTPINGNNTLFSLFVPLAILLLGIQLERDRLYKLLLILIGLGAVSGFLGLLQVIGDRESSLYFYQITNTGSAVGLFANRNHAALLLACMFPMLALYASDDTAARRKNQSGKWVAAAIATVLVPLILVTGSRSGLLIGLLGIFAAYEIRRGLESKRTTALQRGFTRHKAALISALFVTVLGLVTLYFSRAEAIERLFFNDSIDSNRSEFWPVSIDLIKMYAPFGTGLGSFAETFHTVEPDAMLNSTYLNRAHNDWIEIAVTLGVPGIVLLTIGSFMFIRSTASIWRKNNSRHQSIAFARTGAMIIAMIAIASFFDYPLRTPTMMCLFVLSALWFCEGQLQHVSQRRSEAKQSN